MKLRRPKDSPKRQESYKKRRRLKLEKPKDSKERPKN